MQRGSRSSSADPLPAAPARFPECRCRNAREPFPGRPETAAGRSGRTYRRRARDVASFLLQLWLPLALEHQHVLLQADSDVIAGYTPGSSAVVTTLLSPSQMLIGGKSRAVVAPKPDNGSSRSAFAA